MTATALVLGRTVHLGAAPSREDLPGTSGGVALPLAFACGLVSTLVVTLATDLFPLCSQPGPTPSGPLRSYPSWRS
ncbi:MAG: hypothetical protein ACREQL_06390 [Candidatus Binatia bacterium]